ncbi:site-specific integrase [Acidiphilium sp.]|uniref:site-specific integrase n=1 Tax=Acidiphilium sp. TaxID=527 RepID=UPI0025867AA0|nr:site-specific integrase [Acidiphilium sp.]
MTIELAARHRPVVLPVSAQTRFGSIFRPRSKTWVFREGVQYISINFALLDCVDDIVLQSLKATILWYLENWAPSTADAMFKHFLHMFRTLKTITGADCESIGVAEILNYKAALSDRTEWYLGSLASGIKRWGALGYPGVEKEAVVLLNEMRIKGGRKGEPVRTMCPITGPFSEIEYEAIISRLNGAYGNKSLNREDYLIGLLFITLGARPSQIASLKICDLTVKESSVSRGVSYSLSVPRAKQRGEITRGSFKGRAIIPDIGEILLSHANDIRTRLAGQLADIDQAPMFPGQGIQATVATGFERHMTARAMSAKVSGVVECLGVFSERTGEPIHVTPTRLRRTLGTRAAMEGCGELVIAELLDHSDTQNAGVYVESRPEAIERIDKAIALRLAPLAQAFAGVVVDGRIGEGPRRNPIVDPRFDEGRRPAGTCGLHGFCGLAAPIACYPCINFQAWLDGPHEEVLDFLLAEREKLMADGSPRIAAINDRTILAVAEVIRLCNERRKALEEPDIE